MYTLTVIVWQIWIQRIWDTKSESDGYGFLLAPSHPSPWRLTRLQI